MYFFNGILSWITGQFVTDVSRIHVGPFFKGISAWCFDLSFLNQKQWQRRSWAQTCWTKCKTLEYPNFSLPSWLAVVISVNSQFRASEDTVCFVDCVSWLPTEHQKPPQWRIPYKWGWIKVESAGSSHDVTLTQSASIGSLIGKHIFHSIEKTPTDWAFTTAVDGGRVTVFENLWWV